MTNTSSFNRPIDPTYIPLHKSGINPKSVPAEEKLEDLLAIGRSTDIV